MGNIGDLYVNIHANARGLVSGLAHSQKKLRKFSRSAARMGRQMETISRGMIGLGAAFAVPVTLAVREFAKFEKSMANVATMLDEPQKHMRTFNSAVSDMAVEFGETTDALAGGLYDILSASVAPAKALDVLAVSTVAAKAGLTDTKTAADVITTALNSYGLSASEAGHVSDLLFMTVKRGKITFEELAASFGNVSTIASIAGVDIEELLATVASLTRVGIKSDVAMTAIKGVIKSFATATDASFAAAEELNLTLSATSLESEGLLRVMQKLSSVNLDELAKIFPNIRALTGLAPVLKNVGGFSADLDAMNNVLGTTNRAFAHMSKTVDFVMHVAGEAIKRLGRTLGEVLVGDTLEFAETIKQLAADMEAWVKANGEMIRGIVASLPTYAKWAAGIWLVAKALKGVAAAASIAASVKLIGAGAAAATASGFAVAGGAALAGGAAVGSGIAHLTGLRSGSKLEETQQAADRLSGPSVALTFQIAAQRKLVKELQAEVQHHQDLAEGWGLSLLEATAGVVGLVDTPATDSLNEASQRWSEALKELRRLQLEEQGQVDKALGRDTGESVVAQVEKDIAAAALSEKQWGAWRIAGGQAIDAIGFALGSVTDATGTAWQNHMTNLSESAKIIAADMEKQGRAMTLALRTPQETFESSMAKAKELLGAGAITQETFDRAAKDAREKLQQQTPTIRQGGSIQTAIGTYKFGATNRSQQTIATNSTTQTLHQQKIANNTAATTAALKKLGPTP